MSQLISLFLLLFIFLQFMVTPIKAVLSSCSATVSPTSVNTSTSQSYTFTMGSVSGVLWIKITRPSTNFTITAASGSGWNTQVTSSTATFTPIGQSAGSGTLSVTATSGSSEASSADWTVQASDDSGGASPTTCTGTLGTAISGAGADTTAPTISDIVVSDVTDSAVKITWTTNENSDSVVDYGKDTGYGTTNTGTDLVTAHSAKIDNLSANTTYHYNVKSKDSAGNTGEAGDNTFVTAKSGTSGSTQTGTTKTTTITKTVKDNTPPTISLDSKFDKTYSEPPKITGRATDSGDVNPGISRIEYSVDDGKTYLEVDNIKSANARSTTFDFVPAIFEDGNFKLKVRAYDNAGNVTSSRSATLIIDRLPPQVGGILFSIGPQIILPTREGVLVVLKGLDIKITLSSIGGALTIDLFADSQIFSLVKNPDSGLWSNTLNFSKPGIFQLQAKSVDGASNKTEKDLIKVVVLEGGKIIDESKKPIAGASITVYYFEPTLRQFILWDGSPFGQQNPQKTDETGDYNLLLPAGKYYLQVGKSGYKSIKTNLFETHESLPITYDFSLDRKRGIRLGSIFIPFFDFSQQYIEFKQEPIAVGTEGKNKLIGQEMPYFTFATSDEEITTNAFKGKPTLLTFSATWLPKTAEQLIILEGLIDQKQINIVPVMIQEKLSKVTIFQKIGEYKLRILTDPDGQLLEALNIINLPTHVFLDRKGVIKGIKVGVLNKEEVLDNLVN